MLALSGAPVSAAQGREFTRPVLQAEQVTPGFPHPSVPVKSSRLCGICDFSTQMTYPGSVRYEKSLQLTKEGHNSAQRKIKKRSVKCWLGTTKVQQCRALDEGCKSTLGTWY